MKRKFHLKKLREKKKWKKKKLKKRWKKKKLKRNRKSPKRKRRKHKKKRKQRKYRNKVQKRRMNEHLWLKCEIDIKYWRMNYKIILSTIENESDLWFSRGLHQIIQINCCLGIAWVLQNRKQLTKRNLIFVFIHLGILSQKVDKCMSFCGRGDKNERLCSLRSDVKGKFAWLSWWWVGTKFRDGCVKLQKKSKEKWNGRKCDWENFNCESTKNVLSKWYWGYWILYPNVERFFILRTANYLSLFSYFQWP